MRFKFASLLSAAALLLLPGCGKHDAAGTDGAPSAPLKVGIIPFEDVDAITKAFQPYSTYLGKKSGRPDGQVFVTPSYAGVLQALQADQIDCAYLNPLSYVLATQQFAATPQKLVPIAMPYFHGSLTYKGVIFVRADSNIHSLKDLKGKSFAFGDRTSTSSFLYPAGMLKKAGIDPEKDLKPVNISGTAGVLAVFNKRADAGAIYEGGIANAFTDTATKAVDQAKVGQFRIIATTDPIPNGMFVARGDLDPATLDKLKAALANINTDPDGQAALKAIPWNKMVAADDTIFNPVRENARTFGLDIKALDEKKK